MLYNICFLVVLFLIYSFIGYIVEIVSVALYTKKLTFSRGFLIGPYLPIFGTGSFIMIYALEKYSNDLFALCTASFVLCGILEFITSYALEKIYGMRLWDYSYKKFNINGRVCLDNLFYFGLSSVIVVKLVNPFLVNVLHTIPNLILIIIGCFLGIVILVDFIISANVAKNFKRKFDIKNAKRKDITEEFKNDLKLKLNNLNFFNKRLFNAFPYMKNKLNNLSKKINDKIIK